MGIFVEELAACIQRLWRGAFAVGAVTHAVLRTLPVAATMVTRGGAEEAAFILEGTVEGLARVLTLPTDRQRPAVQTFRGANYPVRVSAEVTEGFRAIGHPAGGTLS